MTSTSTTTGASPLSVAEAVNRGYNILAAVLLLVTGLAFSELIFAEPDPLDKIDNTILLAVGLAAVAWYFIGTNRIKRSVVPLALGAAAVVGQLIGIGLEFADPTAIGDDFGGLIVYTATIIALGVVYVSNRKIAPS